MMSDKTNERLEQEARESLVAADLSAKMKQWRNTPPSASRGSGPKWYLLLLLLALGGAAWWFWPKPDPAMPPRTVPVEETGTPVPQSSPTPVQPPKQPVAQKPLGNRYLALAVTSYRSPDFSAEIRSSTPVAASTLDQARRALAENHPADALRALQNVPAAYQTDADYLRGHALFQLKKYAQAAVVFGRLTDSIRYGEAAEWYETLAFLPDFEHQKPLILAQLKKMAEDEGHLFHEEAKRLLTEI